MFLSADFLEGHFIKTSNYFDGLDETDVKSDRNIKRLRGGFMVQTPLFKAILKRADEVKDEFNCEYLAASHIAVAVADFCAIRYTGITPLELQCSNRFEEERLRYIFLKVVRVASYLRLKLSHNTNDGVKEEVFDVGCCEQIAILRETNLLTADILFLCALKELKSPYRIAVISVVSDDSILVALQDADKNVYDYVIDKIDDICCALKKKSDEAKVIRDWKPAAKFTEPEDLIRMVFEGIETRYSGNVVTIKIPLFFGKANLTVAIHKVDGVYYIHDNKCALKFLARNIKDAKKYERAVKKVCNGCRIDKGRITGSFVDVYGFVAYLKDLVFAAHADLYYPKAKKQLCCNDRGYIYIPADKAEPFDKASLINMLKESVNTYYDEDEGLCCRPSLKSSPFQTRFYFLIETLDDERIRISDKLKGKYEGELFEPCYWYNEDNDISVFCKFLSKLAARFGGEFDGKNVYLTEKSKNFQNALFRFFQLAVLISIFGHDIALPKIKREGTVT